VAVSFRVDAAHTNAVSYRALRASGPMLKTVFTTIGRVMSS